MNTGFLEGFLQGAVAVVPAVMGAIVVLGALEKLFLFLVLVPVGATRNQVVTNELPHTGSLISHGDDRIGPRTRVSGSVAL